MELAEQFSTFSHIQSIYATSPLLCGRKNTTYSNLPQESYVPKSFSNVIKARYSIAAASQAQTSFALCPSTNPPHSTFCSVQVSSHEPHLINRRQVQFQTVIFGECQQDQLAKLTLPLDASEKHRSTLHFNYLNIESSS